MHHRANRMGEEPVSIDMLREAVTHEVRQAMTPWRLQVDQMDRDVELMKWTLFGNSTTGQVGVVTSMKEIRDALTALAKAADQRQILLKGIAVGLGVNIALQTGFFEAIGHFLKAIP